MTSEFGIIFFYFINLIYHVLYLLKNSTIIEPELDENSRNTKKILIYGTVAFSFTQIIYRR